jgi:hypothetical protein
MILVDTSVWVDHFRRGQAQLIERLNAGDVACHPLVLGELACGNLKRRSEVLSLLDALPIVPSVADEEVLFFIERHRLFGRGLGLIDVHLLASCKLAQLRLWTQDRVLASAAHELLP